MSNHIFVCQRRSLRGAVPLQPIPRASVRQSYRCPEGFYTVFFSSPWVPGSFGPHWVPEFRGPLCFQGFFGAKFEVRNMLNHGECICVPPSPSNRCSFIFRHMLLGDRARPPHQALFMTSCRAALSNSFSFSLQAPCARWHFTFDCVGSRAGVEIILHGGLFLAMGCAQYRQYFGRRVIPPWEQFGFPR